MIRKLIVVALMLCAMGVFAADVDCCAKYDNWTVFMLCFVPGAPSTMDSQPVCGVKVGAPISAGAPVAGAELSLGMSGSDEVAGVQGAVVMAKGKNVSGLQLAIVNFVENCRGVQLGIFNDAKGSSIQIGILNHIVGSPVPWMPVCNFNL